MIVRYDLRGTGLSDRDVSDFSLDAQLLDLQAVVDRLNLETFDLLAAADSGPVAVAFAAREPRRVSHLILWCAWARGPDIAGSERIRAWRGLIDGDWQLMTETCAHLCLGWSGGEIGRQSAQHLRESVTQETARMALAAMGALDVSSLLPAVKSPTLVLHRRDIPWRPVRVASALASRMPDARLVVLDGEWTAPYLGDTEAAATAIDEFLSPVARDTVRAPQGKATAEKEAGIGPRRARADGLTEREVEVLRLVAGGGTNNEIADELVLSVRTVERHIGNIYAKIGARGRADATAYALTRGLL